jgi:hypothetical protein
MLQEVRIAHTLMVYDAIPKGPGIRIGWIAAERHYLSRMLAAHGRQHWLCFGLFLGKLIE